MGKGEQLMYYPFLRGRQNELLAIRELAHAHKLRHVVPVIEPVKASSTLLKTLEAIVESKNCAVIVQNPIVGTFREDIQADSEFKGEYETLLFSNPDSFRRCYHAESTLGTLLVEEDLTKLAVILTHERVDDYTHVFNDKTPSLTFVGNNSLRRKAKGRSILFADHFKARARNSDYPLDEEFFSDDNKFYLEENYVGFSDYSIIGSGYSEKGFLPRAVAIHLTFFKNDGEVWLKHFVSKSQEDTHDTPGKYYEAVSDLAQWVSTHPEVPITLGLSGLLQTFEEQRFPGLGVLKRLSLMHHIEMMDIFSR